MRTSQEQTAICSIFAIIIITKSIIYMDIVIFITIIFIYLSSEYKFMIIMIITVR